MFFYPGAQPLSTPSSASTPTAPTGAGTATGGDDMPRHYVGPARGPPAVPTSMGAEPTFSTPMRHSLSENTLDGASMSPTLLWQMQMGHAVNLSSSLGSRPVLHRRPVIASADACRHHSSLHLYICLPRLAMIPIMVHHLGVWCRMRRPITLVLYSTLPPWCRLAPRIRHHLLLLWIHPCVACPSPQVTICRHLPTVHCVLRRLAPHHPRVVCTPVRCRRHRSMKVL